MNLLAMQKIHWKAQFNMARRIEAFDVRLTEGPIQAAEIILELGELSRAEDRNDTAPGSQPIQRNLRRGLPGLFSNLTHSIGDSEISL